MRIGVDCQGDVEELARAIGSWLRDDNQVAPDDDRDEALTSLTVFVESLSRVKLRGDRWRRG